MALHVVSFIDFVLGLVEEQHATPFALPLVVGDVGCGLVDLSSVVFVVDGALANSACDHEVLVGGFVGKAGLALP